MPFETKYKNPKLNQNHLSELMKFILVNTGDGIERGQIIEDLYGLERGYCGWWADLCLRRKEKIEYEARYRKAQPVLSKCLNRMEKRDLVRLIRRSRNIKKVLLTAGGKSIAEQMPEGERQHVENWAQEKKKRKYLLIGVNNA